MRAAQIAARAGLANARGAVSRRYAERRRSIVGNTYATTPTVASSVEPRVVLRSDHTAKAWGLLDVAATASDGAMLLFAGGAWSILAPGTDGQVLTMVDGLPVWV
jgi:hypothetical protein